MYFFILVFLCLIFIYLLFRIFLCVNGSLYLPNFSHKSISSVHKVVSVTESNFQNAMLTRVGK